jgi:hypothetical protein
MRLHTNCLPSIDQFVGDGWRLQRIALIFNPLSRAIICDREIGFQTQRQGVQLNVRHLWLWLRCCWLYIQLSWSKGNSVNHNLSLRRKNRKRCPKIPRILWNAGVFNRVQKKLLPIHVLNQITEYTFAQFWRLLHGTYSTLCRDWCLYTKKNYSVENIQVYNHS